MFKVRNNVAPEIMKELMFLKWVIMIFVITICSKGGEYTLSGLALNRYLKKKKKYGI